MHFVQNVNQIHSSFLMMVYVVLIYNHVQTIVMMDFFQNVLILTDFVNILKKEMMNILIFIVDVEDISVMKHQDFKKVQHIVQFVKMIII